MEFQSFLDPQSIAIYGASPKLSSPGGHIFRNLVGQGYRGEVIPINPKYDTVSAYRCAASQVVANTGADLAVIAIPKNAVSSALQDCAAVGTKAAIVITAGFDAGHGPSGTKRLLKAAKEGGVTIMGPNCLGLVRPQIHLNATFQPALPPAGGLALISQSGAICSGLADMAETQGLGFSMMLSLGNSLQFGLAEAIEAASNDPLTRVILAYVEGVRRGDRFRAALKSACRKKPVIVLKAGRHEASAEAATTHTSALVGSDRVFSAVLREAGAVQVQTLGALLQTARLLENAQITGARLAIITNGGGVGVLTADRLSDRSVPVAQLPNEVLRELDQVLNPNWSRRNPLDIVGDATPDHYRAAIEACCNSPEFDAVFTLLSPQSMTAPDAVADVVLHAHHAQSKPILSCFLGGASVASARAKLRRQRVADFDLPEDAIRAFHCAIRANKVNRHHAATRKIPTEKTIIARAELACAVPTTPGLLSDTASRQLLVRAGVPCPIPELAKSESQAVAIAKTLAGPVVLKISSPDISHKSEVDGVRLKLEGEAEVREAFCDIRDHAILVRPDAKFVGVTVEPHVAFEDTRELLIGVTKDPVFGPVITFGAGGTLVELVDDVATALLPLTEEKALQLIGATRVSKLLGAYRNMQPVDINALVAVLIAVSDLSFALPEMEEMDINPLLASPSGLCAVDARIRFGSQDTPLLAEMPEPLN